MHIKNPPSWKLYIVTTKNFQGVDTIMISNLNNEHAWSYEMNPILEALFRYIDSLWQRNGSPNSRAVRNSIESPLSTAENSEERKDAYGRVLPVFLKTRFDQWLFGLRREIERVFNERKSDGVEQPRWYGFHRYLLHVLCCILMHNFEFLL